MQQGTSGTMSVALCTIKYISKCMNKIILNIAITLIICVTRQLITKLEREIDRYLLEVEKYAVNERSLKLTTYMPYVHNEGLSSIRS